MRLWITQGNLAAARRWAQESGFDPADCPVTFLSEVDCLTLARLLIAQGNLETAETLLLRLHQGAEGVERNGSLIEILILQALTFAAHRHDEGALSALGQAFGLAGPEDFARTFPDEGEPMIELLSRAVAQGLRASNVLRLLNALGVTTIAPQSLAASEASKMCIFTPYYYTEYSL